MAVFLTLSNFAGADVKADNVVVGKSKRFAVRVVRLYQYLVERKKEYVLAKQLLRSDTSIGANVHEAVYGFTKKDFRVKMSIALKECAETIYWLELLHETKYLTDKQFSDMHKDCEELLKILTAIVKTSLKD